MKRVTKHELALSLHAAGRTVNEIANTLESPPALVADWLECPTDDLYSSAGAQAGYARMFRGVLRFQTVQAAQESVGRLDALWCAFLEAGDVRGMHQAQLMALIGKNRSESIGKETCARYFGEWLAAHLWTPSGRETT